MTAILFCTLTVLMAADVATTIFGIRRGCDERNRLADALMRRFGLVKGATAYQLGYFALFAVFALGAPDQWAVQALGCICYGRAAVGNVIISWRCERSRDGLWPWQMADWPYHAR